MLQAAQINKLQKIQNKCMQLINMTKAEITKKYVSNRMLKVNEIIDLELAKIGYHLVKSELPSKVLSTIATDASQKSLKNNIPMVPGITIYKTTPKPLGKNTKAASYVNPSKLFNHYCL